MSELKAFDVGLGRYTEDGSPCVVAFDADQNPRILNEKVYLKSEADKVIAEKDVKIAELKDKLRHYPVMVAIIESDELEIVRNKYKILHHKYKRCLDKAKICESEEKRLEAIAPILDTDKECWEYDSNYWVKWNKRWL